jgi:NADP-dependent 3-hydroxy acid dehydrogenase YdfG
MNVLRKELPTFVISEICPGKTKTNMLKQNYNGAKSDEEICAEYESSPYLTPLQVAKSVLFAVENQIDIIKLTPHG